MDAGTDFVLYISGITTPLSTESTSSFEIATTDADGYYIDSITADLYVTMARGKTISAVEVYMGSDVVGATDSIRIFFDAPSPFEDTYLTYITFPDEVVPPEATTKNLCYSNRETLKNRQYCEFSGQEAWLTLKPESSITAGDQIYYRIDGVVGPTSGDPTS
jgi:hypothetical protein